MKAIIYTEYGPPEVAKLMEVSKPIPKENEVLVKVYASTVNRTDAGFRSAEYFISRFWSGLFRPKYQILGCEFAGIIEEIGKEVTTGRLSNCRTPRVCPRHSNAQRRQKDYVLSKTR